VVKSFSIINKRHTSLRPTITENNIFSIFLFQSCYQ
jgi:hypothetical protein